MTARRLARAAGGRLRAGPLADGLRGDRRPARHRDQARPAAAGLAAARRARAVRAARHRPLDAAPGADGADPERPPLRRRAGAAAARSSPTRCRPPTRPRSGCSPNGARSATSAWRSSSASRCWPPSAPAEPALAALDEVCAALDDPLEDFAAYRQADVRLHIGLAEATGSTRLVRGDDRGAGRDDRPDRLHRAPARGPRLLQRPAPAAARRGARGRRDARARRSWPSTCTAPSTCSPGCCRGG